MYWQSDFPPFSSPPSASEETTLLLLRIVEPVDEGGGGGGSQSLSLSLSLYPPFPLSLSPFGYSQNGKRVIETMAVRYIFLQNSLLSPPVSGAARVELSSRPKFLRPLWREYRSEKRKRE